MAASWATGVWGHFGPDVSLPLEVIGANSVEPEPGKREAIEEFLRRDTGPPHLLRIASHQPHLPFDRGNSLDFPPPENAEVAWRRASWRGTGFDRPVRAAREPAVPVSDGAWVTVAVLEMDLL